MDLILFDSPLGWMGASAGESGAVERGDLPGARVPRIMCRGTPLLAEARRQLLAYLAGELREFNLPLSPAGTQFQRQVWEELRKVPYGGTVSYGELARRVGRPKAARAVGQANHNNPIPIIIPCHRVVGSGGALTGYAGGLEIKEKLLRLEGAR